MADIETVRQVIDAWPDGRFVQQRTKFTHVGPVRWTHFERPIGWATDLFRAIEADPVEVVRAVQSCQPGPHQIRAWTVDREETVTAYARLGYRSPSSGSPETIMVCSLVGFTAMEARHPVQSVQTEEQRQIYNSAIDPDLDPDDPHGRIKVEQLDDPTLRHYFVELDGQCVGYARAIRPLPSSVIVEPLWTRPKHRRRGIATAVMNRLHADAAGDGAEQSVLMASPMGVPLYRTLGYEVVAYVQKFVPQDSER